MDKDLKEALDMVQHLRGQLWLMHDEGGGKWNKVAEKSFKDGGKLLAKHGYHDDYAPLVDE